MATINLTSNFDVIPEGEDIFRVYATEYKETFGALKVFVVNAKGRTAILNYKFMNTDGSQNDTAYSLFSWFARAAMGDKMLTNVDPEKLINKYIKAKVTHSHVPSRENPGETMTFVNLRNYEHADGFTETPTERAMTLGNMAPAPVPAEPVPEPPKEVTSPKTAADLMALLSD